MCTYVRTCMYASCTSVRLFIRTDVPFVWNDNSWCITLAVYSVSEWKYAIVRLLCMTVQAALLYATRFDGRKFVFCTGSVHFMSGPDSAGTKVYIRELESTWKSASSRSAAEIFHVLYGIQRSLLGAGACLVPTECYPLPDVSLPYIQFHINFANISRSPNL